MRVLIVEDSDDDARSLEHALDREGFAVRSCRVEDPEDLRQALGDESLGQVGCVARRVLDDVASRRRKRAAEAKYAAAFRSSPNPLALTALEDGRFLEVNDAFSRVTGYRREEILGKTALELGFWPDPEARERFTRQLRQTGSVRNLELAARRKDGQALDTLVSAELVDLPEGKAVLSIVEDVTERNALQAQLLRTQRLEILGTLAGGLAHDLNNVLTPILMAIRLLRKKRPDQSERILEILESNANRGADLIRQLLGFARGHGGKRVPVHFDRLVGEIETIVQDTFPESIDLDTHVEPHLWRVEGDPTQLYQVLLNLVLNARDAMDGAGSLSIHVRNREVGPGDGNGWRGRHAGRYLEIEVTDSGPGIPEELRPRVFDPFFTTKEPGSGTGLGLFTVETIVRTHGGFMELGSARDRGGTRFRIYLPAGEETRGERIRREAS